MIVTRPRPAPEPRVNPFACGLCLEWRFTNWTTSWPLLPRAASFVLELEAQCRAVAAAPSIYPARFDLASGLRMAAYGRYLVFFRELPEDHKLRVERVRHSARDVPALFR